MSEAQPLVELEATWAAICPERYRTLREGGKTNIYDLHRLCPEVARILEEPWGSTGILLRGPSGACKTRAMWRLLRRFYNEGKTVVTASAETMAFIFSLAQDGCTLDAFASRLTSVDALFIDDLGSAPWSPDLWLFFFKIIEERWAASFKPIFLATVHTDEELAAACKNPEMGKSFISMLHIICWPWTLRPAPAAAQEAVIPEPVESPEPRRRRLAAGRQKRARERKKLSNNKPSPTLCR